MKRLLSFIILFFLFTSNSFARNTEALEVDELESYMQKGVVIIDIRDEKKWKRTGIIPSSYRLTYNDSKKDNNEKKWLYILIRLVKDKNRAFVLISKDGKKAKNLAFKLYKEKKFSKVLYLKGGVDSWIDADRKMINY